jgi:hypothetical protein
VRHKRSFFANASLLLVHAPACIFGNFLRDFAASEPIRDWSLTTVEEKVIKIGAEVVSPGRGVTLQMAEVSSPRDLFADDRRAAAAALGVHGIERTRVMGSSKATGEARLDNR